MHAYGHGKGIGGNVAVSTEYGTMDYVVGSKKPVRVP